MAASISGEKLLGGQNKLQTASQVMGAEGARLSWADNANSLVDGDSDLRLSELHLLEGLVVFALSTNNWTYQLMHNLFTNFRRKTVKKHDHFLTVTAQMKTLENAIQIAKQIPPTSVTPP